MIWMWRGVVRMRGKKLIDKTMYPHTNAYVQAWGNQAAVAIR